MQNSYFRRYPPSNTSLFEEFNDTLDSEGQESLQRIKRYFGNSNIINMIRNQFAFHYDREETLSLLPTIQSDEELCMFLSESGGNCLFVFSDDIVNRSLLSNIDSNDPQNAINILYKQINDKILFYLFCINKLCEKMNISIDDLQDLYVIITLFSLGMFLSYIAYKHMSRMYNDIIYYIMLLIVIIFYMILQNIIAIFRIIDVYLELETSKNLLR